MIGSYIGNYILEKCKSKLTFVGVVWLLTFIFAFIACVLSIIAIQNCNKQDSVCLLNPIVINGQAYYRAILQ